MEKYSQYIKKITKLRNELGLSQQELSELLNKENRTPVAYSKESISRLESGKRKTALPYKRLIYAMERIKKNEM